MLFVLGWAGLLLGLALSDSAVFQSETVAKVWVGAWAAAIVVAILFLATAASEWLGLRRPRHQRRRFPPFR
ncbi:MAG TPA: hypothetical protein VGX37_11425 [Allosphingosinicella sp.]|nr:hypothetical protein [Allosphingosinicella sp.]